MHPALAHLSPAQRRLLREWLPDVEVVADHSWGLVSTRVLEVVAGDERYVVKAAAPDDHHLVREVRAHREWLAPLAETGHAARLVHADLPARVLVTTYLPGRLVEGDPAQDAPATYLQAGRLLARLHGRPAAVDERYVSRQRDRTLRWLDRPHRIPPGQVTRLRTDVATWQDRPVPLVPAHGDWHPRNWVVDDHGVVRMIDLGRADLRCALEDLVRLARQDFDRDPALEAAFLDGYGCDPREPDLWHVALTAEAVGTAVWAHQVGDEAFEEHGLRCVTRALEGMPGAGDGV